LRRTLVTQTDPRRRSMRLAGFDYAEHGAYFVTICTLDRLPLFGDILREVMRANAAGTMIERWWRELPSKYKHVEADEVVVMPNHVHGLLFINGSDGAPLPRIMQWFKTMTTNAYFAAVRESGWASVSGKLWQRGYYDHIVRRDEALNDIRQYIIDNPRKWAEDELNPRLDDAKKLR
jgi:putative transposase